MRTFKAKLRRVGSSVGLLVPRGALEGMRARVGDTVEVAVMPTARERRARLEALIGSVPHLGPFRRERRDRF